MQTHTHALTLFLISLSAPLLMRRRMHSCLLYSDAMCRDVLPSYYHKIQVIN